MTTVDTTAFFNTAKQTATQFVDDAHRLLGQIATFTQLNNSNAPAQFTTPTAPTPPNFDTSVPAFTGSYTPPTASIPDPTFIPISPAPSSSSISSITPPNALDTSALFQQTKPSLDLPPAPSSPTVNTNFVVPDAPTIDIPVAPEVSQLNLQATPRPTVPTFDAIFTGTAPGDINPAQDYASRRASVLPQVANFVDNLVDGWVNQYIPEYNAAMSKLEKRISEGLDGTVLPDSIEQRIFDRGRNRVVAESQAQQATAVAEFAKRGFVAPPGAMHEALRASSRDAANRNAEFAAETAIERTKIEIQHLQFCMNLSGQLRQAVWSAALGFFQAHATLYSQAIEDAKTFASMITDMFKLYLDRYRAEAEVLRVEAEVYDTRLKAALADLEAFKIELEAERTKKSAEQIAVDAWKARIDAQQSLVDIYSKKLEAINTRAKLEQLKVNIFESQVRAYGTKVQSKELELKAYEASLAGDTAKVTAYTEQVRAYQTQIDAEKAKLDAGVAVLNSEAAYNRAVTEKFQAQLQKFEAQLKTEGLKYSADVEKFKADVARLKAVNEAKVQMYDAQTAGFNSEVNASAEAFRSNLELFVKQTQLFLESVKANTEAATSAANVAAQVAGSALGSMNAIAHEATIEEITA